MVATLILPGFGGSGEEHWQTIWERRDESIGRFNPASWIRPDLNEWMGALERAVAASSEPPIVVAHSLACLLVAHWGARAKRRAIRGAFLVAVPNPDSPEFPPEAASFRDIPSNAMPFPTLVVTSSNDPYGSLDYVRQRSADWKAGLVEIGAFGHINSESGLGEWAVGRMLLEAFRTGAGS